MKFQLKAAVILALLAGFAFAASNAFAQAMGKGKEGSTMEIVGGADASFGTLSREVAGESESGFGSAIQSNIILTGKDGSVDYYVRLRLRGQDEATANGGSNSIKGQLQTSRLRVRWTPSPLFNVSVGRLPSIGGVSLADRQPGRAYVRGVGVSGVALYDATAIDLRVTPGPVKVGYVISTTGGNQLTTIGTIGAQSAVVTGLYAQAKFGGIRLGFRNLSYEGAGKAAGAEDDVGDEVTLVGATPGEVTNGVVAITATAGVRVNATPIAADPKYKEEGTSTVIEAAYAGGPLYVAFESTSADEVVATAGAAFDAAATKPEANTYSGLGLAVEFAFGQGKAYFLSGSVTSGEDSTGDNKSETSSTVLGYKHTVSSKAVVGVENASVETTVTKAGTEGKPTTTTGLRFYILTGF